MHTWVRKIRDTLVSHHSISPSFQRRFTGWTVAMSALITLQCMDLLTTGLVLWQGGVELNPLFSTFVGTAWFWPAMGGAKIVMILWIWIVLTYSYLSYPRLSRVFCGAMLALYAAIVENNLLVILAPGFVPDFSVL